MNAGECFIQALSRPIVIDVMDGLKQAANTRNRQISMIKVEAILYRVLALSNTMLTM
jgi:hypothetical protein